MPYFAKLLVARTRFLGVQLPTAAQWKTGHVPELKSSFCGWNCDSSLHRFLAAVLGVQPVNSAVHPVVTVLQPQLFVGKLYCNIRVL